MNKIRHGFPWRRSTPTRVAQPGSERGLGWSEEYLGGSLFAETEMVRRWRGDIHEVQYRNLKRMQRKTRTRAKPKVKENPLRAFHVNARAIVNNAVFRVASDIPSRLQVGFFKPGAEYSVTLRLSHGSSIAKADTKKDMHGFAFRVHADADHDFLLNTAVLGTRTGDQALKFFMAESGSKLLFIPRLILSFGPREAFRILRAALKARSVLTSFATVKWSSRAPFAFGGVALKYGLFPAKSTDVAIANGPNATREDFIERLKRDDIVFDFKVQLFVNEELTPIEDGSVNWDESVTPFDTTLGQLIIPRQDLTSAKALATHTELDDKLKFNPWNNCENFMPLGSVNRARRAVYQASQGYRSGTDNYEHKGIVSRAGEEILIRVSHLVNRFVPWYKLPTPFAILNLIALRIELRRKNLFDTNDQQAPLKLGGCPFDPTYLTNRSPDGSWNDLTYPEMGKAGQRFGRLVPREETFPQDQLNPTAREVSNKLHARREFIPATSVNLLLAAWVQVVPAHDLFRHPEPAINDPVRLPLKPGDTWPESTMAIHRDIEAPLSQREKRAGIAPVYENDESHWWDASFIYGSSWEVEKMLRTFEGGRLKVDEQRKLLLRNAVTNLPLTGFTRNMWLGPYIIHAVFALEHNALADAIARDFPGWTDQQIFDEAHKGIANLIDKIHTIEWTTALLQHKALQIAMRVNWFGLLGEKVKRQFGRLSKSEVLSGIPGSAKDHENVPFAGTEEFVAVYRMHPLLPDHVQMYNAKTGEPIGDPIKLEDMAFTKTEDVFARGITLADALYTFGRAHPGALTLHNYPEFMRNLDVFDADGKFQRHVDMATIDTYRDRNRGIPRYCDFRRLFHMSVPTTYDEITGAKRSRLSGKWKGGNAALAADLRATYGVDENGRDRVELVDTMTGLFAEPVPEGFAISDTAFRVFILIASRRIKSDRFLTDDFRLGVYTQTTFDWIADNNFGDVVVRHFPELEPALRGKKNAFWGLWNDIRA